ncbi:MAG: HD domain-containing protein [Candidatus Woesearchaeota archaeon]|nr:MAG: HD domain-containing protein [Candidatus Woesearchaeota archaeon]
MAKRFHHFKGNELSRSEKIERKVIQMLLDSNLPDSKRDSSIIWEIKHISGCISLGRILALKRNLDLEICDIISSLHDSSLIVSGSYKEHAKKSADVAKKILQESGEFTNKEIQLIITAIANHSAKNQIDDPYSEFIKDVDVLDCSLYQNSLDEYTLTKSPDMLKAYENRLKNVRKELGLPVDNPWRGSE